ncbi:PKD domain-containing protein [Kitasatospora sp. YST-16]|uniref:PKD domain-containing protein n=1 Tax=Kitasatospora sp. YST-16 TaxID=2998080 RepID=UPI002284075B|nr:PKD domain-containing protein [Kitasatospora sp. YST-16]WAL72328.1 PKD domain-containing protein [Kitasatospora sp. YST-16]WNW38376.1 PKD domain-containing protein [Streptomyces sp. Li-HN-5-13]
MPRRSISRRVGLTAAIVGSAALVGVNLPAAAAATFSNATLHVDGEAGLCTDTGPGAGMGSTTTPFCTIQAAVDYAQPGDTVLVEAAVYNEQVTPHRSGTPEHPITVKSSRTGLLGGAYVGVPASAEKPYAFVLSGVHDIVISDLSVSRTRKEAVLVENSDRITVARTTISGAGAPGPTVPTAEPGIRVTGTSAGTVIDRSVIGRNSGASVAVEAGATGTVITNSSFINNRTGGVTATDAPGTVVAGNTLAGNCGNGLVLDGASSGSVVKNNVIALNTSGSTCTTPEVDLSVSAGSTAGTTVDYNIVYAKAGGTGYSWAGTPYTSQGSFAAASGQGAHDIYADPKFGANNGAFNLQLIPQPGSPAIDSGDASAPGADGPDILGRARVDDPATPNTGTGSGILDRGAFELNDPLSAYLAVTYHRDTSHPQQFLLESSIDSSWSQDELTASLDFGDGSPVQTFQGSPARSFSVLHDYPRAGTFTATLTVTSAGGVVKTTTARVDVPEVPAIQTGLPAEIFTDQGLIDLGLRIDLSVSPWPVTKVAVDWGDGRTEVQDLTTQNYVGPRHPYSARGDYQVKVTLTDDHGRVGTSRLTARVSTNRPNDVPVSGRWKAGPVSIGVFNSGAWELRSAISPNAATVNRFGFGQSGDKPAVGDWDGLGYDQIGIYRNGLFALQHANGTVTTVGFGEAGDVPVPGYWDGNKHAQLAIYRPSSHLFAVRHDDGSVSAVSFGDPNDFPIVGDWDGTGHTQMGIYRPSTKDFALRHDNGTVTATTFGTYGNSPVVGDWYNVGRAGFGVLTGTGRFSLNGSYAKKPDLLTDLY